MLEGQRFDLVYSSEVIEHIPDPNSFILALKSALKPEGVIFLTTPNADYVDYRGISIDTLDSNSLELIGYSQHCSLFSSRGMQAFFKNHSLFARVITPAGGLKHRMVVVAGKQKDLVNEIAAVYESALNSKNFESEYVSYLVTLKGLHKTHYGLSLGVGASFRLLGHYLNSQNLVAAQSEIEYLRNGQLELEKFGIQNHIQDVVLFYKGQYELMSGNLLQAREAYSQSLTSILSLRNTQKTGNFYSSSWSANILVPLILAYSRTLIDLGDFSRARKQLDIILRPSDGDLLMSFGRVTTSQELLEAQLLDGVAILNLNKPLTAAFSLLKVSLGKPMPIRKEALRLAIVALKRVITQRDNT